ncbi:hypothetical protein [Pseudomonas sp. PS02290]|uniref:hypothetical protein n=1 Tax=Pseudomonas sp. PS02290 TaxID=2991430 RepID=UPI00249A1E16|nr:hypothetical protein [Pseudomonas sp. PS02290]
MIIKLSPQRRDDTLEVIKIGKVLLVNGETFDLSPMTEGATLPWGAVSSMWFAGDIDMQDGEITLTMLFPLPYNFSQAQAWPVDLVNVPDGVVQFPPPLTPEETAIKFPPRATAEFGDENQAAELEA